MARKNPMATPASQGNSGASANMPANNVGTHATPLGSSHNSTFKSPGPNPRSITGPIGNANMPAHNKTGTRGSRKNMGTTHHGVGQVPGYLKGGN